MATLNVLIPIAGLGSRFRTAGYTTAKPLMNVTGWNTGKLRPMLETAVKSLPLPADCTPRYLFVLREDEQSTAMEAAILAAFPSANIIRTPQATEGQACSCLLAKAHIDNDTPLLISACDFGMVANAARFVEQAGQARALIFTFRNHPAVLEKPEAYGWVQVSEARRVQAVSVKVPISSQPLGDHAVAGAFWFRHGKDFVVSAEAMIAANERIREEFYVDQAMNRLLATNDVYAYEVERYFCWGTPQEYENYQRTAGYWRSFCAKEQQTHGLSLVIPCYNEAENLPALVAQLRTAIAGREDVEVLLVDNGSTDNTPYIMAALSASEERWLRVVRVPENIGYGHGILQGLAAASRSVLAWTHADLQTDPADVLRAYALFQEQPDACVFIKGRRRHRARLDALFTWGMQALASCMLGVPLKDINAQPKLFSRGFYDAYLQGGAPTDFSLDLFALWQAARHGCPILEVPVDFSRRLYGMSKGGGSWKTRLRLIRRTLIYIWRLR